MNVTYLKPKKKRTNKNLTWFGNMLKFTNEWRVKRKFTSYNKEQYKWISWKYKLQLKKLNNYTRLLKM